MASADASQARGGSAAGKIVAIILAIIAVVAIIAAIMYFTEPAKSLPSVLGTITQPASRADAHRSLRGVVSIVVGVILLVAAGITAWMGRSRSAK